MNINSSNYFSVSASTNKGISGLASGLDTENMVKQMLASTQGKIDKQEQLKQQTVWTQECYRDIISTVNTFYNKYFDKSFDSTLATNFATDSFFNSMTSGVKSGDAVRVISTNTSAAIGDVRVAVEQLATNSKMESTQKMSGTNTIVGTTLKQENLVAQFEKKVSFVIGAKEVTVNLNSATTDAEMVERINTAFQENEITDATAKIFDGKLRIVTTKPDVSVTLNQETCSQKGLEMTGLSNPTTQSLIDGAGATSGQMLQGGQKTNAAVGINIQLTLDGVQKQITLNKINGEVTPESIQQALQQEVTKAFGNYISVNLVESVPGGKHLELGLNVGAETGHQLTITGADATKIGVTPGASTRISVSTKLNQLPGVEGDRFSFAVNGKSFTFNGNDSIGNVMNAINSSGIGVKMSYSSLSDTFRMESTSTGAQYTMSINQQEGNLFSVFFGDSKIAASSTASSKELTVGSMEGNTGGLAEGFTASSGASFRMNVNGKDYTFTLPSISGISVTYSKAQIEERLNTWLSQSFGTTGPIEAPIANISYADGKLNIADGFVVKFTQSSIDLENSAAVTEAAKTDLALALGFNKTAASNVATANTNIADVLQLKDHLADFTGTTLKDLKSADAALNLSFSSGRLTLTGNTPADLSAPTKEYLSDLFGTKTVNLSTGSAAADAITTGEDAKLTINGVSTTRSSNTFTMDGLTIELSKVSGKTADGKFEETVIGTTRDAEKLVSGFKTFVEDYNTMIQKLNGYVDAEATYRKYPPLTAEQKKEMSETEIKLWEEKSKQGLLHRDSTVDSLLMQMRTVLYTKPTDSKLALYDIGIETSQWKEKGKLTLDENKLRNAIASDPDSIKQLFTNSVDGLAAQLMKTMDATTKVSTASPGMLVQMAGTIGSSSEKNNMISRKLVSIDDRLTTLKTKYESEKARYWKQFNSMEQIIANFNSQSAQLTSQFSGY